MSYIFCEYYGQITWFLITISNIKFSFNIWFWTISVWSATVHCKAPLPETNKFSWKCLAKAQFFFRWTCCFALWKQQSANDRHKNRQSRRGSLHRNKLVRLVRAELVIRERKLIEWCTQIVFSFNCSSRIVFRFLNNHLNWAKWLDVGSTGHVLQARPLSPLIITPECLGFYALQKNLATHQWQNRNFCYLKRRSQ